MGEPTPTSPRARRAALLAVCAVAAGVAAAAAGLLPWLSHGMRLTLQNLWATPSTPEAMPIVLMPFSQYAVALMVVVILVGSAIAGLVARAVRAHVPRWWWLVLAAAALVAQVVALVQTVLTVAGGLLHTGSAALYLFGLSAGVAGAILVGAALLALIARSPAAGATIALTLAAVALGPWLDALVVPVATPGTTRTAALQGALSWIPAIVVGLALGWCGVHAVGRIVAVIVSLVVLWLGPILLDAVSGAFTSRALLGRPAEMASSMGITVRQELGTTWPLVLVAIVVGAFVAAAFWLRRRSARPAIA